MHPSWELRIQWPQTLPNRYCNAFRLRPNGMTMATRHETQRAFLDGQGMRKAGIDRNSSKRPFSSGTSSLVVACCFRRGDRFGNVAGWGANWKECDDARAGGFTVRPRPRDHPRRIDSDRRGFTEWAPFDKVAKWLIQIAGQRSCFRNYP